MKKLLMFLIFQGSLDCFSQSKWPCETAYVSKIVRVDTIPSHLLVTHHPPCFAHSIEVNVDDYLIFKRKITKEL